MIQTRVSQPGFGFHGVLTMIGRVVWLLFGFLVCHVSSCIEVVFYVHKRRTLLAVSGLGEITLGLWNSVCAQ